VVANKLCNTSTKRVDDVLRGRYEKINLKKAEDKKAPMTKVSIERMVISSI
jgi:hypothetical protein